MVQLDASKKDNKIIISEDSFEHLLNCLDNQKFIRSVNADGIAMGKDAVNQIQSEMQTAIDGFSKQCRDLLHNR